MTTDLQDRPDTAEAGLEYRPISLLAVLGFLIGLVSIVALVAPPGWVVPAAGAMVSAIAALRINANSERLAGRRFAIIGLCLSLWFGAWAPTKYLVDRYYLAQQSQKFALEWLTAVLNNDLEKAHQGTLEFRYRQPDKTDLKEHYNTTEVDKADMQEYFTQGLIKDVIGRPLDTTIENMRVRTISLEKRGAFSVVLVFEINTPNEEPILMAVETIRDEYKGNFYWRITGAADPIALFGENA